MSVTREEIDGCTVAVIEVSPSTQPPVRLEGRAWIRVGPRRAIATAEEERRLTEEQVWQNLTFDARPCADASLDDLDLHRFETEYVPSADRIEIMNPGGFYGEVNPDTIWRNVTACRNPLLAEGLKSLGVV